MKFRIYYTFPEDPTSDTQDEKTNSSSTDGYSLPTSDIYPIAQPSAGGFRNIFRPISPQAAQYIPQAKNVEIADKSKIGIDIFNNPQRQIPWTAIAIQQQQPSVNTKAMQDYMKSISKVPKTDPRLQANLDLRTGNLLTETNRFLTKYGSKGLTMLQTGMGYDEQSEQEISKLHNMGATMNALADVGTYAEKKLDAATQARNDGKLTDPYLQQHIQNVDELAHDMASTPTELQEKLQDEVKNVQKGDTIQKYVEDIIPKDYHLNTTTLLKPAALTNDDGTPKLDKKGNPVVVPDRYLLTTVTNDPNNPNFQISIGDMADRLLEFHPELKKQFGYDHDKLTDYLLTYFKPQVKETQMSQPAPKVTVNVGDKYTNALPTAPKTVNIGGFVQNSTYATSFKPVPIALGNVHTAISTTGKNSGVSSDITIGQNAKANGIVMLNVALQNKASGGGLRIVSSSETTKDKNTMQVPFVQVDVPKQINETYTDTQGNVQTRRVESQSEFETVYVPLSEAQGDLINSANKEDMQSIQNTIKQYSNTASELNDVHSTKEANEYYKEHFTPSIQSSPSAAQGGYQF